MQQPRSMSFSRGKGKLTHNTRELIAKNVDQERIKDNIVLVNQSLKAAYIQVFGAAQEEYNARQKRKDRRIDDYFTKLFGVSAEDITATAVIKNSNNQQSFYEWVLGVGSAYDTALVDWVNGEGETVQANSQAAQLAAECLTEYIYGNEDAGVPSYEERNPNFHLMSAIIHMDEKTPHMHIDAIPFSDGYKTGMTRQQGIAKALDAMGYGIGETAIAKWQESERAVFRGICESHGFVIRDEEQSRGYTVLTRQYGEYHENELKLAKQAMQMQQNEDELAEEEQRKAEEKKAAEQAQQQREEEEGRLKAVWAELQNEYPQKRRFEPQAAYDARVRTFEAGIGVKLQKEENERTEQNNANESVRLAEQRERDREYTEREDKRLNRERQEFEEYKLLEQRKLDERERLVRSKEDNINVCIDMKAREMNAELIEETRKLKAENIDLKQTTRLDFDEIRSLTQENNELKDRIDELENPHQSYGYGLKM